MHHYVKWVVPTGFALWGLLIPNTCQGVDYEFSGYSRVVAGILDDSELSYFGYDDSLSFDNNSLLGLQGRVDFTEQWSVTGLALAHSKDSIDSGIEWLYVSWQPLDALTVKAGKMQTPFFSLSDVLDIGYAYPWVMAPREVYNDFIFESYQGIDLRYTLALGEATLALEGYYGFFKDDISINSSVAHTEVDDMRGSIAELSWQNWRLRASYHTGDVEVEMPELESLALALGQAGFTSSAGNLETQEQVDFIQLSAEYDSLSYFFKAEYADTRMAMEYFPEIKSFYLTAGYHFDLISTYLTYGQRRDSLLQVADEIPSGVSPELDALNAAYSMAQEERIKEKVDSWTLGVRWDFRDDMALKTEIKNIHVESHNSTILVSDDGAHSNRRANLLLVAWEWVF